jgi:hypothetical protein
MVGFVLSVGLLFLRPVRHRGRRRPCNQGDLERLASAVVDMLASALQRAGRFGMSTIVIHHALMLRTDQTNERAGPVRSCGCGFSHRLRSHRSREAAATELILGQTHGRPRSFLPRAQTSGGWQSASAAEDLHLNAVLNRPTISTVPSPHARERSSSIQNNPLGWSRRASLLAMGRLSDARSAFERAFALEGAAVASDDAPLNWAAPG